ncbi:MAG: Ig domain-containing protein [Gemmatimonadales bacterium]
MKEMEAIAMGKLDGLFIALPLLAGCAAAAPEGADQPDARQAIVALTPDGMTIPVGDSLQMKAVLPGETPTWRWSISNGFAASIDPNGLVRALAPGDVIISACADEFSRTCGSAPLTVK